MSEAIKITYLKNLIVPEDGRLRILFNTDSKKVIGEYEDRFTGVNHVESSNREIAIRKQSEIVETKVEAVKSKAMHIFLGDLQHKQAPESKNYVMLNFENNGEKSDLIMQEEDIKQDSNIGRFVMDLESECEIPYFISNILFDAGKKFESNESWQKSVNCFLLAKDELDDLYLFDELEDDTEFRVLLAEDSINRDDMKRAASLLHSVMENRISAYEYKQKVIFHRDSEE